MYSTEDFSELDKTNFKCYKFPDGNIYYGEVAFMNPEGQIVTDPVQLNDEEIKKDLNEKKIITITLVKNKFPSISSIEATWYIISPWAWIQFDSFLFIIIHNIIRFILLILTYETRKNINMNKELILSKDNILFFKKYL